MSAAGRGKDGKVMGVAAVGAVALALGAMYASGRDVKKTEGRSTIHGSSDPNEPNKLNSSDVSKVVSNAGTRAVNQPSEPRP